MAPPDPARLAFNQATTRVQWNLAEAIRGYARHDVRGIAVWRDRLAECGLDEARRLLDGHGMAVTGLCRGGLFTAAGRQAALDDNRRAVDEAAAIGARCLVIVAGGLVPGSRDIAGARSMVAEGLADLLPHARAAGVPLAIEPLHPMYAADRCCVNTIGEANDLCDRLGDGVGIAVDVYHLWWDPNLERELHRAGRHRLLAFHICDWLVPTTDLLLDRGMMGDGVIDIPKIRGWIEAAGYDGFHEVEIFSRDTWWRRDPDEVVRICRDRHQTAS